MGRYRRVLLKLSGEALMGAGQYGIDAGVLDAMATEIGGAAAGTGLAIVIGGGNIFRGISVSAQSMDRAQADLMGMLATIMNSLALADALGRQGVRAHVQSALPVGHAVPPFERLRALALLDQGDVVIFAAGTGNPFFTTDTAASVRALEMRADIMLKATKVDGVYSADPKRDPQAVRYRRLSYDEVLRRRLGVMDATAIALLREYRMPLRVFNMTTKGMLARILAGEDQGTLVEEGAKCE
ncbi:MAG: UMP kinase [Gammaproteobacteria bacterium]|nr:UMP kinase [Gammaproteobacteria bacterium]